MSELDKIRDDIEKYYAETEAENYNLVKDLRNKPLFTLDTLFKFAAMYIYERANGVEQSTDQALHKHNVSNNEVAVCKIGCLDDDGYCQNYRTPHPNCDDCDFAN